MFFLFVGQIEKEITDLDIIIESIMACFNILRAKDGIFTKIELNNRINNIFRGMFNNVKD